MRLKAFLVIVLIPGMCLGQSMSSLNKKIWVKVLSNDVNRVWFIPAKKKAAREQQIARAWVNEIPGHFLLNNTIIERKSKDQIKIADLPVKYRKVDGTGKWLEMTPAEKAAVDAADKDSKAKRIARTVLGASLRELVNETFGSPGKEITEQELIDRIKSKLSK